MRKALAALALMLLSVAAGASRQPAVLPAPPVEAEAPGAAPPAAALTATDVGTWLDGFMPTTLQAGKIAGAQVVIVKDGQVLFKKGYGYADVAAKRLMDPDRDLMRIGSTSKLFTWTAVMQLVEAGKIDLNADINRYLDFKITPQSGRAVTMTDLMTHRAGFEEGLKDLLADDPRHFQSTEQYLKQHRRPQLLPAGTAPAYSNYGAALAGYIVQRVSGEPFEVYVRNHILAPLHMGHTTLVQPLPPELATLVAKGYRQSNAAPEKFELVITGPAGAASTTAADMANFMIAQLQLGRFGGAQILRPETASLMQQPSLPSPPGFDTLAHGSFRKVRNGMVVIGHGGDTIVFHSDLNMLPEKNVGIFVSFNSRGERDAAYGARERLFDLFLDRYFGTPVAITPPAIPSAAHDADLLAGRYEGSRRVETGFISLFYLLQQNQVVPNSDGTISMASVEGKRFREIKPNLWREVGGTRSLLVTTVSGRLSILDSQDPVEVLQKVPLSRNAAVFQLVLGLSLLILVLTVVAWPIAAWVVRHYRLPPLFSGRPARLRRLTRIAALGDLAYIAAWYSLLAPILQIRLAGYNGDLNTSIRVLQVAAIVPIGAAVIGAWNAWSSLRVPCGWGVRVRTFIVEVALLGICWAAWMGGLFGWSVNY